MQRCGILELSFIVLLLSLLAGNLSASTGQADNCGDSPLIHLQNKSKLKVRCCIRVKWNEKVIKNSSVAGQNHIDSLMRSGVILSIYYSSDGERIIEFSTTASGKISVYCNDPLDFVELPLQIPMDPPNGTMTIHYGDHSATATFECDDSFTLDGDEHRTFERNESSGRWSWIGTDPACKANDVTQGPHTDTGPTTKPFTNPIAAAVGVVILVFAVVALVAGVIYKFCWKQRELTKDSSTTSGVSQESLQSSQETRLDIVNQESSPSHQETNALNNDTASGPPSLPSSDVSDQSEPILPPSSGSNQSEPTPPPSSGSDQSEPTSPPSSVDYQSEPTPPPSIVGYQSRPPLSVGYQSGPSPPPSGVRHRRKKMKKSDSSQALLESQDSDSDSNRVFRGDIAVEYQPSSTVQPFLSPSCLFPQHCSVIELETHAKDDKSSSPSPPVNTPSTTPTPPPVLSPCGWSQDLVSEHMHRLAVRVGSTEALPKVDVIQQYMNQMGESEGVDGSHDSDNEVEPRSDKLNMVAQSGGEDTTTKTSSKADLDAQESFKKFQERLQKLGPEMLCSYSASPSCSGMGYIEC